MDKDTRELLAEISQTDDIVKLLAQNDAELLSVSVKEYLAEKLKERDKTVADVIKNTTQGDYLYKVFSGQREPSRDILVSLAFGLEMDLAETQTLLRLSGAERLDPRVKRDAIAIFGIVKGLKITDVNDLLAEVGEYSY